eukprot:15207-Heterococcus_DN1.PRE.1
MMRVLACLALLAAAKADLPAFTELTSSGTPGSQPACAPFKLPAGFQQKIVIQNKPTCAGAFKTFDVYADGTDNKNDMMTVNENAGTASNANRFLYRTHEESGKACVSVVDLVTGATAKWGPMDGFSSFDGIEWTPWNTLLAAEESGSSGRLFEFFVDLANPLAYTSYAFRPAVGRMSHEGIAVDKVTGYVYVGDELTGGSLFRFVPTTYGNLSAGTLYCIKVRAHMARHFGESLMTTLQHVTNEAASPGVSTGPASWVVVNAANARADAVTKGCSKYARPEDAEIIGRTLYVSITGENRCAVASTVALLPVQCSRCSQVEHSTSATIAATAEQTCNR